MTLMFRPYNPDRVGSLPVISAPRLGEHTGAAT
jgi:hypothetical protein